MAKYMQDSTDIQINEVSGTDNINFSFKNGNSIDTKIGNLTDLETTDKSSVVNAINSVVDSGGNANGNWVKYADGTMICYGTNIEQYAINTAAGSLYRCDPDRTVNLPQEFVGNYIVNCTGNGTANIIYTNSLASNKFTCYVLSYGSRTNGNKEFLWQAIGRWK